jgi:hypothetical protein
LLFVILSLTSHDSKSQRAAYVSDTLLPFFGNKPIRLHGYENRMVPFNSKYPLYVMISYPGVNTKQKEYFRIDSSNYLVYEFFRSDKGSSVDGLKSRGIVRVVIKITDSGFTRRVSASSENRPATIEKRNYLAFSKEGEWEEFADSLFFHRCWKGVYTNNKRTGIWDYYIYDPNSDKIIYQIDYDKDSTRKIYTYNLAGEYPVDSLQFNMYGRWMLGCEDDKDRRMLLMKCELYDGHYGDDCNNFLGKGNYYEFLPQSVFKRQRGETCDPFKQAGTTGKWKVYRKNEDLLLEIKLASGAIILYKVWYLDREGNMVVDRF